MRSLRPCTRASKGLVTAPHYLAAQAGLRVLEDGGNAADAAVCVAACLSVVYPHMTGLGGDGFFLYYAARERQVFSYNGSGAAAGLADTAWYRDRGHRAIPERGAAAALTVPGAVDAWFALHQRFGRSDLARLLEPGIEYAEAGAPIAASLGDSLALHAGMLNRDIGATEIYAKYAGTGPGALLVQPRLAAALRSIAREGREWFYSGAGAAAIAAYSERAGGPLRLQDLAAHRGCFVPPARGSFLGYDSLTTPPNSQGIALLIAQQTLEQLYGDGLPGEGSAELVHASVEAIKAAYQDRDAVVCDPECAGDWEALLKREHAAALAKQISPFETRELAAAAGTGDTAYFAAVDADGNAVSYIQSLFHSFGSGIVVPELGIALNNRGTAFSLEANSLRRLVPGRRPYHTLMPCMLLHSDKPWLVHGSMGGEGQPQTALAISTRIAGYGMDPQSAIEAPRWRWGAAATSEPVRLHIESRFDSACLAGLRARGHELAIAGEWDESMGHAGAILIADDGVLSGGADPRGDGAAVGY